MKIEPSAQNLDLKMKTPGKYFFIIKSKCRIRFSCNRASKRAQQVCHQVTDPSFIPAINSKHKNSITITTQIAKKYEQKYFLKVNFYKCSEH